MWSITNHTPFKAESTWGRDKDGVHEWIVAVKATYDIQPNGDTRLSDEQLDPLLLPEYNGESGMSSLRYDADLVAPKPTTDLILNGSAYAPQGRPSKKFLVAMRVGKINKILRVIGNSRWEKSLMGLLTTQMEPITEIPIIYERAYGGYDHINPEPNKHRMDSRNPVGCGVTAHPSHREGQPLPNFEYPQGNIKKTGPAGFGAIDSFWSPRREFCGTYDKAWQQSRCPLLPNDWDARTLLCSPGDQLPSTYLRGGELVELANLTREGLLRFSLPKVHLSFATYFGQTKKEHRSKLSAVIIEPDYPRVIMVWLSALTCRIDVDYLDRTVIREKRFI